MSVSPGAWLVVSSFISLFLALGLVYAYKTICALRYGDSDLQKYGAATIVFFVIYSMIMLSPSRGLGDVYKRQLLVCRRPRSIVADPAYRLLGEGRVASCMNKRRIRGAVQNISFCNSPLHNFVISKNFPQMPRYPLEMHPLGVMDKRTAQTASCHPSLAGKGSALHPLIHRVPARSNQCVRHSPPNRSPPCRQWA